MNSSKPVGLFVYMVAVAAFLLVIILMLSRNLDYLEGQEHTKAGPVLLGTILALGALGAQIQALLSLADYVGNGKYQGNWNLYYYKRPFVGAVVALLVFSALSGGIAQGDAAAKVLHNYWGMVSICLISGLFSRQAMDKMAQIFSVMFAVDVRRKDSLDDEAAAAPVLEALVPDTVPHGAAATLTLKGTGFDQQCKIMAGDNLKECVLVSETELQVSLTEAELSTAGQIQIAVKSSKVSSQPQTLTIT